MTLMAASSASEAPHATQLPRYFAVLYAMMIVYTSLEPFSSWMAPPPGTPFFLFAPLPTRFTRFDIVINVVAYMPFGFFLGLVGRHRSDLRRLVEATLIAALLSLTMEKLQMFLAAGRASTGGVAANTAGAAVGALIAVLFNRTPGLRARVSLWRHRFFLGGRSGDLGLALLGV